MAWRGRILADLSRSPEVLRVAFRALPGHRLELRVGLLSCCLETASALVLLGAPESVWHRGDGRLDGRSPALVCEPARRRGVADRLQHHPTPTVPWLPDPTHVVQAGPRPRTLMTSGQ